MNKKKIREHLQLSFKERMAFIIVVLIIAIIFAYPFLFHNKDVQPLTIIKSSNVNKPKTDTGFTNTPNYYPTHSFHNYNQSKQAVKLFYFDPNTATEEQWQSLGLRDRTIRTIKNYLSKGGSFKKKEDLEKIYGLHEDEYTRLEPYVRIAAKEDIKPANNSYSSNQSYAKSDGRKEHLNINDINTANADAFIALPGIGDKLASRIISFRDKLGGFYSVEQVKETYGLPDSTFQLIRQYLKLGSGVKKLNINTASKDDLKSHPYIRWNLANAIIEYRSQHGVYKSLEDLKNIILIDDATYKKIIPYLGL